MEIADNGIGIGENAHGNGLNGMKERLALVNGTMSCHGYTGTTVTVVVPFVEIMKRECE